MTERPKARDASADLGAPELDAFLRDLESLSELDEQKALNLLSPAQLAAAVCESIEHEEPPAADLRAQLMAALTHSSRFERFASLVSELLDIEPERAERLLDQLDNRSLFYELMPGIELFWVEGGPRVANAVRGFRACRSGPRIP